MSAAIREPRQPSAPLFFLAGLLTLIESLFGIDLTLDAAWLPGTLINPGRMALGSAVAFQACGLALTLLGVLGPVLPAIVVDALIILLGGAVSTCQWDGLQDVGMAMKR